MTSPTIPLHTSTRVYRSALFIVVASLAMAGAALYNTFTPAFADRLWAGGMITAAFTTIMFVRERTAAWWHTSRIVFITACSIRAFAIMPTAIVWWSGIEGVPGNLWLAIIHWAVTGWFAYEAWPTMFPRVWVVHSGDRDETT